MKWDVSACCQMTGGRQFFTKMESKAASKKRAEKEVSRVLLRIHGCRRVTIYKTRNLQ